MRWRCRSRISRRTPAPGNGSLTSRVRPIRPKRTGQIVTPTSSRAMTGAGICRRRWMTSVVRILRDLRSVSCKRSGMPIGPTRGRVGDAATMFNLVRTQSTTPRRPLVAMARAAAATPPWATHAPCRPSTILIDHDILRSGPEEVSGSIRCATAIWCVARSPGTSCTPHAVRLHLMAQVRRVVYDAKGVVIDLGRRQRLFMGASPEAVMLLATVCAWVGCDHKAGVVPGRSLDQLESPWMHRAMEWRSALQAPQPAERTRLPSMPRRTRPLAHLPPRRTRNPLNWVREPVRDS